MAEHERQRSIQAPEVNKRRSRVDSVLRFGVWANVITVPIALAFHRPDIAFWDIFGGAAIEEGRRSYRNRRSRRGRERISPHSRLALAREFRSHIRKLRKAQASNPPLEQAA